MKFSELTLEDKKDIIDYWNNSTEKKSVKVQYLADIYSTGTRTIYYWIEKLNKNFKKSKKKNIEVSIISDEAKKIHRLEEENKVLKSALKEAKKHVHNSTRIDEVLYQINGFKYNKKAIPNFNRLENPVNGVPVLMLSDLHYGETVNPSEVGNVNEYNSKIAEKRINYVIDQSIKIILNDWTAYKTEWMVLPLIGDICSGTIHDELTESNDQQILPSVLNITDILIQQIHKLKASIGKVYVPCVVGNHGRLHKKPRAKGQIYENYEFMIYKLIERHFNDDNDVIVEVSDMPDMRFDIFGKRFLLTHGHTLGGGGGGIAGILPLLYRGNYKKQERATSVNNSYDTLLIGHWHQSLFLGKVICNGTTKGIDEYALNNLNIPYEPPSQNLFMVDRNFNDITYRLPIFCEPAEKFDMNYTIKTY